MAYTDYIRIYGLPQNGDEVFQGLGAAAMYNAADSQPLSGGTEAAQTTTTGTTGGTTTPETTTEDTFPQVIWDTQNEVIKCQSDMLATLSGTYADKLAALPQQPSWLGVLTDSVIEWAVGFAQDLFFLRYAADIAERTPLGLAIEQVVSFLTEFSFKAWDYVKTYYNKVGKMCMQMQSENTALLSMTKSAENYGLRAQALAAHEASMKNIVELIRALEDDMRRTLPEDMTQIIQALRDLRFNGASIQWPNGSVFTMVGPTVVTSSDA